MQRLNLALLLTLLLSVPSFGQTLPTFWSGLSKPVCSAIAIEQTSPEVGDTLTVDSTWVGHRFEVRTEWYVNDVLAYTGESFNTTGVTEADDVVYVTESGLNAAGGATRTSASVTMLEGDDPPPLVAPTNTVAPVITGTATPGYTLTCSTGSWTSSPTSYSYQWMADNSDISGATSSTYVVQAGDVGKAIRCEVAATNAAGTGGPATSSNAKTIATAITIDSTWLTTNDPSPYYLNQQGKTYVLDTDVTTDGTAFAIIAQNVTFDLNEHTVTYNNATPITIANGSFETGKEGDATEADDWDFTNAAHAERHEGVWLYNETYDGDYSIKFNEIDVADEYIESDAMITLAANTTYSLSGMFEYGGQDDHRNPDIRGYIQLIGTGEEDTRECYYQATNWRGIQHQEGTFTTGDSDETYNVRVGVKKNTTTWASSQSITATSNNPAFRYYNGNFYAAFANGTTGSTPPTHTEDAVSDGGVTWTYLTKKPFYIDDIKIQRTKTFGVMVSPKDWNPAATPDLTTYGDGTNATIKNGTITQGQDKGTWSHGVLVYQTSGVTIEDMNVTVAGANCSALMGYDMKNQSIIINSNTLTSNAKTITSREAFDGAVMHGLSGTITNNTITNGPHAGIFTNGNFASDIAGNTIQLKVRYTNAFAILGGPSSQIYNNTINNGTGEFSSRGIAVPSGTAANPSKVYNNTIAVQNLANNQEYGGAPIGGTYGIQAEGGSYAEVYDNSVTVYGTTKGFALRLTSPSNNLSIHDNTFTAIANGTGGHAAPLSLVGTDGSTNVTFEDNTFITNDGIIGDISNAGEMELVRTTFEVDSAIGNPWHFQPGYSENPSVHSTLNFVDTTYADGTSRTFLENAPVEFHPNEESASAENRIIIALEWTTTLQIKDASNNPLSGASVTIKDKNNDTVYTGTTDESGEVTTTLKQQQMQGDTKTTYNDYTATVEADGYSFSPATFTADEPQTITVAAE